MTLKARAYQYDFMEETKLAMKKRTYINEAGELKVVSGFRRICGYLPQGSGKSVVIAFMGFNAVSRGNKVLILTHREEIFNQNFKKIAGLGVDVATVNPRTIKPPIANCSVAMSQTLSSRLSSNPEEWEEWLMLHNFIIVDEPHRGEHDSVMFEINPNAFVVGLSASIARSGNKTNQLGAFYDCIVTGISTSELIELGYLVKSENYTFQAPKLSDLPVSVSTGDYTPKHLQDRFKKKERYAGVIWNYQRLTPGTKAIAFTTGSEHCIDLCIAMNEAGIPAKYLLSKVFPKTDKIYSGDRETVLREFSEGKFKVLCNLSILDTGFDEPSIETVILDFATESYTKYAQCVGRGSRPCLLPSGPKTHFNVLDFGGNIERHGIYERDDPPMSLWHNKSKPGVAMTKECPLEKGGCGRLIPISAKDCPYCGHHFATEKEIYTVELQKLVVEQEEDRMTLQEWCAHKKLKGWKTDQILCAICIKNCEAPKAAFMEAIKVLRGADGEMISPKYWHVFQKRVLRDKASKQRLRLAQNSIFDYGDNNTIGTETQRPSAS